MDTLQSHCLCRARKRVNRTRADDAGTKCLVNGSKAPFEAGHVKICTVKAASKGSPFQVRSEPSLGSISGLLHRQVSEEDTFIQSRVRLHEGGYVSGL
jgi:hypothetical protein